MDLVAALFGGRGTGKSTQAMSFLELRRPSRVLIWDTMDEYQAHGRPCATLTELLRRARSSESFALRYVPRGTDKELRLRFEAFCAAAYSLEDLVLVVEELQRVTTPSWAPPAWSDCTLRGRHKKLIIFGISQRPASVDKNFFSQASVVSSGRLVFADDVACLKNVLGVPGPELLALPDFHYIARDMKTGKITRGELGRTPAAKKKLAPARKPLPSP